MRITLTNTLTKQRIVLRKLPAIFGRHEQADVQIDDSSLRPYQATMDELGGGIFVIWDLHDGRGTLVNGRPCLREELVDGDTLTLGETSFVVEIRCEGRNLQSA